MLRLHADQTRLVERETRLRRRFDAAHPQVATAVVPALAGDVHDLHGLRRIGELGPQVLDAPDVETIRGDLQRLVADLERHRQHLNDLVYDSVSLELGGSE